MTARWILFLLMAAMGVAAQAQSQSQNRFALTAAQVALAVSASGMPTAAEHVSLLTRVVATEPEPVLDVLSVETLGKGPLAGHSDVRFRVKLACHVARRMPAVLRHRQFHPFDRRAGEHPVDRDQRDVERAH